MKRRIKIEVDVIVDNYEEQYSDSYLTYALEEGIAERTGFSTDDIIVEVETLNEEDDDD